MLNESLAPGRLPRGQRVYAIGDVHGCAGELRAMHAAIAHDARRHPFRQAVVVYLGDYVDRGPDSAGVLDLLLHEPLHLPRTAPVMLIGNHETMMLDAADPRSAPGAMEFWLQNGGDATLASYGVPSRSPDPFAAVPDAHLTFLRRCPLRFELGDYLFAHAGVRPDVPLDRQDPFDLLWIREPFLSFQGQLEKVVVHGHSPAREPEVRPHRIGIDTGACFGGPLTCVVLEADRLRFLQV